MSEHKTMDLYIKIVARAERLQVGLTIVESIVAGSQMMVDTPEISHGRVLG